MRPAVHRLVGGAAVFRRQLEHLIEMVDADVLELRIIPFGAGAHVGMLNGFVLLEFDPQATDGAEPDIRPVAYVEYHQIDTMFFDEPAAVDEYARTFAALRARSFSQRESRSLLLAVTETL
jgi:hypothetical protein